MDSENMAANIIGALVGGLWVIPIVLSASKWRDASVASGRITAHSTPSAALPDDSAMEQDADDAAALGESPAVAEHSMGRAYRENKLLLAHVATMKAKRKGVEGAILTKALAGWRMRTRRAKAQSIDSSAGESDVAAPEELLRMLLACQCCYNAMCDASFVHGETAHLTSCFECASQWVDEHGSCPHCRAQCVVVRTFLC